MIKLIASDLDGTLIRGKENKNVDRFLKKEVPVHIFYTIVCKRCCQWQVLCIAMHL